MFFHARDVVISNGPWRRLGEQLLDLDEVMLRGPVPRTVDDDVACLKLLALQQFEFEFDNVAEVASVSTTAFLEHHGTRVATVEETPLLATGDPVTNLLTVDIVGILLIERWFREVNDLTVVLTELIPQLLADCGFADPVWTGNHYKFSFHGLLWLH